MITVIITSPCGKHEWQHRSPVVPRVGEQVTCRKSCSSEIIFTGIVDIVHYEVRMGFGVNEGNATGEPIVSVWLKEFEE